MPILLPLAVIGAVSRRLLLRSLVILLLLLLVGLQAVAPYLSGPAAELAGLLPWLRLAAPVDGGFRVHQPWTAALLHDDLLLLVLTLWLWWPLAGAVEARQGRLGLAMLLAILAPLAALPMLLADGHLPATGLTLPVLGLGFWVLSALPGAGLQCWIGLWLGPWVLGRRVVIPPILPMLVLLLVHGLWLLRLGGERILLRPDPAFFGLQVLALLLVMVVGLLAGRQVREQVRATGGDIR